MRFGDQRPIHLSLSVIQASRVDGDAIAGAPPSKSQIGNPVALPVMSHSAISMALIALHPNPDQVPSL